MNFFSISIEIKSMAGRIEYFLAVKKSLNLKTNFKRIKSKAELIKHPNCNV